MMKSSSTTKTPVSATRWFFLLACLAGSVACGTPLVPGDDAGTDAGEPDAGPGPDAGGPFADVAAYCAGQVDSLCRAAEACDCPGASADECMQAQMLACENALAPLVGAVVLGRVSFDHARGDACIAETRAFAERCAPPTATNRPRACLEAFIDRAALGEPCTRFSVGLPCADGQGACTSGGGPAATCTPLATEGAPCGEARCVEGLACDGATCVVPGEAGSSCVSDVGCVGGLLCNAAGACGGPAERGEPCVDTQHCAAGLSCRSGTCGDAPATGGACDANNPDSCAAGDLCLPSEDQNACAPRALEGEPCPRYDDCADGLTCDFASPTPTCRTLPPAGMPCVAGLCASGAGCNANGICEVLPGEGAACLLGGAQSCAAGLGCDADGLCAAGGTDGEPCVGGVCAAGLVCDFALPALCRARGTVGAPCTFDDACQPGLHCNYESAQCAAPVGDGAPCTSDAACAPGSGCIFDGTGNTCQPLPSDVSAPCDQRCGGGLRCALPPGVCAAGACVLVD